jgi:hypothetical protein
MRKVRWKRTEKHTERSRRRATETHGDYGKEAHRNENRICRKNRRMNTRQITKAAHLTTVTVVLQVRTKHDC